MPKIGSLVTLNVNWPMPYAGVKLKEIAIITQVEIINGTMCFWVNNHKDVCATVCWDLVSEPTELGEVLYG